jgi:hypothetical protein
MILVAPVIFWFGRVQQREVTAAAEVLVAADRGDDAPGGGALARARSTDVATAVAQRFPQADGIVGAIDAGSGDEDGVIILTARRSAPGEAREMADAAAQVFVEMERSRAVVRLEREVQVWRDALDRGLADAESIEALASSEADAASISTDIAVIRYADRPPAPRPTRSQLLVLAASAVTLGAGIGAFRARRRAGVPV